ncbi:MAG: hypothetical protein VW879_10890, partial [Opitutae bacterium]
MQAAELIAFEILNPVMRSRGKVQEAARELSLVDQFKDEIEQLIENGPTGTLQIPSMQDLLERIEVLEQRVK